MIVGNGEIGPEHAAAIDAADLVVRFNDCRSYGAGGTRTDIVAVCNTGRPALSMLGGGTWKTNAAVRRASEIWCTRAPEKFKALRGDLAVRHPSLEDFCDDYSAGFSAFAAATGRRLFQMPAEAHAAVDDRLSATGAEPYVVPSSGMLVIDEILDRRAMPGDRVTIAGFGHQGWAGHPFAAEKRLVDSYIAAGRLQRLETLPL
ncbi:Urease operon accessory protein [Pararhizobium antarcticum]|uniref:Urease operon accessory protein n=1 Tax=Pararhizobium antarcticum TaxID=1798805 RepID=A0A657LY94_9HYPH|nr:Urease operon accessory protein [Pararhizobium antarcticum]OJF97819.1 Urease operon accessory protein [Rhizobium sp. 58]OJF98251.1 Urease operon accessory protein [Pararhizobium antarcticum]